jgi:hypothetical protein
MNEILNSPYTYVMSLGGYLCWRIGIPTCRPEEMLIFKLYESYEDILKTDE